jgi:hypothetical protein
MSGKIYWNLAMDPNMSGGLRTLNGPDKSRLGARHV